MSNACLFSGGKDSTIALHRAIAQGIEIDLLITIQTENEYSYMFHYPNIDATKLQAQALGIRQVIVKTKGDKEDELRDLEIAFVDNEVKTIVSGAIASIYQKERIEAIAKRHNVKSIAPLWHINPQLEFDEILKYYNVIISQVSAEGFDKEMLGKRLDQEMITKLKALHERYGISLLFEGGEAETFVLDAPLFKKKIVIDQAQTVWEGTVGRYLIERAHLEDKK